MDDEGTEDTFPYTVDGKEMSFYRISDTRRVMINRIYHINLKLFNDAVNSNDVEGVFKHGERLNDIVWTAIESQIMTPEDLAHIHMAVIAGRVDTNDLMPLLANGHKPSTEDDDAAPAAAKPRKRVAKKAPAKRGAR